MQYSCPMIHSYKSRRNLVLGSLLVDISLGRVLLLVELVAEGILGSGGTGKNKLAY